MILADKIIELRKKNGWSQEELAEKLNVSRQSVSKWESAQSVPDMTRILLLSELFGVSTDYLLKDSMEEIANSGEPLPEDADAPLQFVSMQQARSFLSYRAKAAMRIPLGVLLCILSPVALILLGTAQESGFLSLSEQQALGLGLLTLILFVGIAVALFILSGLSGKPFVFLEQEPFETEYGVSGYVKEQKEKGNGAFTVQLVVGIVLCVMSAIPIFAAMLLVKDTDNDFIFAVAVAILLCFVAVGVWLITHAVILRASYEILLEEGDHSRARKQEQKRMQPVVSIYWSLVTAGYLAYSFVSQDWQRSWIVWPVAGVLFGIVMAVASAIQGKDK